MNAISQLFTSTMKNFEDVDVSTVERFFSIDDHVVTFNQTLVDSTSIVGVDGDAVSVMLNLKDGTCMTKAFIVTAGGIVENTLNTIIPKTN